MYQLVETIRIMNGEPQNLKYHQERYERSFRALFGRRTEVILETEINVPPEFGEGKVKCRYLYGAGSAVTEFHKYTPVEIHSLKLVESNEIEYSHKLTDRTSISNLLEKKGGCDDILIIKNGLITDSSSANITFFDGKEWFTPSLPLLEGTARRRLLSENKITSIEIRIDDLRKFSKFRLINAMREFDEQEMGRIEDIK